MTFSPMDPVEPGLWMNVGDMFHIKGRGTVVTGLLEGDGELRPGDALVCEGQHWPVSAIEAFRAALQVALPGANIGILLRTGPEADVLRGKIVQFVSSPRTSAQPPAAARRKLFGRRG